MLKTYLMENYGYNEPIFLNDLTIQGLSENAVRQAVKRLVAMVFWNGMIMESIIFQSVTDYLGRVILIRRWLLCANIYKVIRDLWVCHRRIICQSVRINNADASGD